MATVLVSYHSRTGNTKAMAEAIAIGLREVNGIMCRTKSIVDTTLSDLLEADAIILGSPTYFGQMSAEVKDLIDQSIKCFGRLNGKVGGAFTSSGGMAGGNETALMSIIQAMLVHGMVIPGVQNGSHYGPVAVRKPNDADQVECQSYGKLIGELVLKLAR